MSGDCKEWQYVAYALHLRSGLLLLMAVLMVVLVGLDEQRTISPEQV